MKREIIDEYEIYIDENGKMKFGTFVDYNRVKHYFEIDEILEKDFIERRKKEYVRQYEKRRHLDTSINREYTLECRAIYKEESAEQRVLKNEFWRKIIIEICKLPYPQNKRTYLKVIENRTLTEIAKIEKRNISAIKRSVDSGIAKIRKKIENF